MPSTNNRQLTLTTVNDNVTVNVTYNAVFTEFERHLCRLGLAFRERIAVIGVDEAGPSAAEVLVNFPSPNFTVTDGTGSLTIARNVSMTVPRSTLQDDEADEDEIRCRIRIETIGFPPEVTSDRFTTEQVLLG